MAYDATALQPMNPAGKQDSIMTTDQVIIFDTTLRDGEQSLGLP